MKKLIGMTLGLFAMVGLSMGQVKNSSSGAEQFKAKKQIERKALVAQPGMVSSQEAGLQAVKPDPVTVFAKRGNGKKVALRLADTRPFASKENARITLDVQMDWGDGSGYQVLLDADATAYGDLIPAGEGNLWVEGYEEYPPVDEVYAAFEYKIPEDATGVLEDGTFIMAGNTASIDIPAGTYDATVVNPSLSQGAVVIYIAAGDDARIDDYAFAAGTEYVFAVTPDPNGQNDHVDLSVKADYDLALTAVTNPVTGVGLAQEDVTVMVENRGAQEIASYEVSYMIDEGTPVTETVSEALAPGATKEYTFTQKADLSQEGHMYAIEARVSYEGDEDQTNDALIVEVFHVGPVQPPFLCDFDEEADMDLWTVIDGYEDAVTWEWSGDGTATVGWDFYNPLDDYMVTLCPVSLEAGNAYIAFEYNAAGSYLENLAVLYGTSSDPEEMTVLRSVEGFMATDEMQFLSVALNVEEAGDYYFAFHAYSEANQFGIYVDNVEINQGTYVGKPDLEVAEVILPSSACGLSATSLVQARVRNVGRADIVRYSLAYALDGNAPVSQEFGALPVGTDTVVSFTQTVDLSAVGSYTVSVTGTVEESASEAEELLDNNTKEGNVTNFEPVPVPFTTDFAEADQAVDWVGGGSWAWDDYSGSYVAADGTPLVSRCITLEEGTAYRFSMEYTAGMNFMGFLIPESFYVMYGLSGSDMETWDTIWNEPEAYESVYVTRDASLTCEAAGDYAFAVFSNGGLYIREISVSEVTDYDVRVNACQWPLARVMPVEHANGTYTAQVTVENRGALTADVKVDVLNGTEVLGTATGTLPQTGETLDVEVEFALEGLQVDDELDLTLRAVVTGHEAEDLTSDNELVRALVVSQDEMAYDNVTEEMFADYENYAIGSDGTLSAGIPFSLHSADTLTHIMVGWGAPADNPVVLSVHHWDAATGTLGDLVYEAEVSAGSESAFVRYETPGLLLEAGDYMISETSSGYILMADMTEEGLLYVTSSEPPVMQQGLGYPAIRAVFGSDAVLKAKDAAVDEITRPRGDGLFAANQEVAVKVTNMGYEEVSVPVVLVVNKEEPIGPQTVTLAPYASGEVSFTVDMSAPSTEYVLTAIARLEGDEDASNDTATKVVNSLSPADPYEMNFEYCEDWATEGFNPAWTSVDADGTQLGGWQGFNYPLLQQQAGFFVFNPALTEPSILDELGDAVAAHSGERYGASMFSYVGDANDDWLISPKLMLPATGAKMSLYVKSYTGDYGLEQYNVLVSGTDNDLESFSVIGETREAPADAWTLVEVDLAEYAGKEVYLAIQCISQDVFMFMVDDIVVSKPAGNEGGALLQSQLSLYPNPASDMVRILSTDARINQVSIVNLSGALVYESAANLEQTEFRYNVSGLNAGIYFARVKTDQGTAVLKFVVR